MLQGTFNRLGVRTWDSDRTVLRALRRKFRREALTREHREARHQTMREILRIHHQWQKTCVTFRM